MLRIQEVFRTWVHADYAARDTALNIGKACLRPGSPEQKTGLHFQEALDAGVITVFPEQETTGIGAEFIGRIEFSGCRGHVIELAVDQSDVADFIDQ